MIVNDLRVKKICLIPFCDKRLWYQSLIIQLLVVVLDSVVYRSHCKFYRTRINGEMEWQDMSVDDHAGDDVQLYGS